MCTVETATETENAGIIQTRCFKNRTSSVIAVEHDELEKWDAKKEEITNEKVREKKWKKKKKKKKKSNRIKEEFIESYANFAINYMKSKPGMN